jgi:hypothetical protein|tara:strand:+ start:121 stop:369 length:249 start_codon:yes stop_codon:yes gene_type:complete
MKYPPPVEGKYRPPGGDIRGKGSYLWTPQDGLVQVWWVIEGSKNSPSCPECGFREAGFSTTLGTWQCHRCGLYGVELEEWIS